MVLRLLILLACSIGTVNTVFAQSPYFNPFQDSILPNYRLAGELDSVDTHLANYATTLPRTNWLVARRVADFKSLTTIYSKHSPKRFSAIPHIGLAYSIGTNATQQAGLSYTQRLSKSLFFQMDYRRTSTKGALRNSADEVNEVNIQLLTRKKRFASNLEMEFYGQVQQLNGGLLGDSSITGFPMGFQDVELIDATSTRKHFNIDWSNYFAFNQDSLRKYGLYIRPQFEIRTKRYTETGNIAELYGKVNFDSTTTADFWEHSKIGMDNGFFFHTETSAFSAGLNTMYWDFDNFSNKSDTTEVAIVGSFGLHFRELFWNGKLSRTLAGAIGEQCYSTELTGKTRLVNFSGFAIYQSSFPLVEQRTYLANTLSYQWTNKVISDRMEFGLKTHVKLGAIPLIASVFTQQINKIPVFTGTRWRQDIFPSLAMVQFNIGSEIKSRSFFFQPRLILRFSNIEIVPKMTANARIGFKGGLFKAKKLVASIGLDLGYSTGFVLMNYEQRIDAIVFPSSKLTYSPMPKLHAFGQFEIGMMRWFLRVENIEQAFITTENQELIGYPVLPMQLRIGLTWDLFN